VVDKRTARAKGKLIHTRKQHAVTASAFLVAVIVIDVEAVCDWNSVVNLTGKAAGRITLVVSLIFRERVVRVVIKAMNHTVRSLQLECTIVGLARVEGTVERRPVLVRSARINIRAASGPGIIRRRACWNLIEVFSDAEAIRMHANIAGTQ